MLSWIVSGVAVFCAVVAFVNWLYWGRKEGGRDA